MSTAPTSPHPDAVDIERLALVGDVHGNTLWMLRTLADANGAARQGAQAALQLGDFGIWPGTPGQRYLDDVETVAARLSLTVYVVPGNHEDWDQIDAAPRTDGVIVMRPHIVVLPTGTRWTWAGQRWVAIGGAVSIDRELRDEGKNWWPQEVISPEEAKQIIADGQVDVVASHDAPDGITVLTHHLMVNGMAAYFPAHVMADADAHRDLLGQIVQSIEPTHLWHGHYHHAYRDDFSLQTPRGTVKVRGLDCDGAPSLNDNMVVVDLPLN
ncbi:MAG: metallophosphoesterase [Nocardioidaceae bacterium]